MILFIPFIFILIFLPHEFIFFVPVVCFMSYEILFVRLRGWTPGIRLLKSHITMNDGSKVTWKPAIMRVTFPVIFSVILSSLFLYFVYNDNNIDYFFIAAILYFASFFFGMGFMIQAITIPFNKRRKGINDWIAGTVVVLKNKTS